ncbi:MAG TPA: hypothetical protein VMM82_00400, partial [Spirochaetia bacterium]|nr:hypothetical protein [Spirochaetia bacterium]
DGIPSFLPAGASAGSGYVNGAVLDAAGNFLVAGDVASAAGQTPCSWKNGALTLLPQASMGPLSESRRILATPR